ncbi:hypothetical protein E2C01_054048 [Portunus trituberculatus]|uniref:Uncharacterized protein n=1 Tax=Portunus trituberculatus TaxID=210409 RepID=A0A5B7GQW5_PORTR|nr:hypothetical protein [Portunus trituberculatus]
MIDNQLEEPLTQDQPEEALAQDQPEEALTQDQPDDDQPEEGRAAADSDSQPPHLEREDEQRATHRLGPGTRTFVEEGVTDYKDTKKKTELWARKARELDIEGEAVALRTWWNSARDLYAKLLSKKSGQAAAPSSTTTRPRRAATRAEPEDSSAMMEMRDCMKATNALMERLVQAQKISHARQPFITYMSQSLQRLPEAQYQLALHHVHQQQHYFQPQPQHHGFQQQPLDFQQQPQPQEQPQHFQQFQTPRVNQPSSTPRSSNEELMLSDKPNFSSINLTNMSAFSEGEFFIRTSKGRR